MLKIKGFYFSRKHGSQWVLSDCLWVCFLALLIALLLTVGLTRAWSQSNDSKLNGSENILQTWSELYSQGQKIYEQQRDTLANLNKEITTLRIGYDELTNLSGQLSTSNENLRLYNNQIAERMQERDEDLAWAYNRIDALEISQLRWIIATFIQGAALFVIFIIYFSIKSRKKI
ncbi:MAG: hypothetical protein FWD78_02880 [Treponema sp.]|nr:hypothetical protein [Treponema sp.]